MIKKKSKMSRSVLTNPIQDFDTEATFLPCAWQRTPFIQMFEQGNIKTMADIWEWSLHRYWNKKVLGTREISTNEAEVLSYKIQRNEEETGKYHWMTYSEVEDSLNNLGNGLRVLGQRPHQNICIFADTRAEWMVAAQACFRNSFPVVTIYTSLGMDGILHCLVESEVEIVITSKDLLPKLNSLLQAENVMVKTIIYMENPVVDIQTTGFGEDTRIISFTDAVSLGKRNANLEFSYPTPETVALISYTSGSTGQPKGVILTHRNLVAQLTSFQHFNNPQQDDLYIAYLPLAHAFEFLSEHIMLLWGVGIGYSHPNTLFKGDATILQPTIMICVPAVLERIHKRIKENIRLKNHFLQLLFEFCIDYKIECSKNGEGTPIMDKVIFKEKQNTGGRLRTIVSAGAPLAQETHAVLRAVLGITIQQGYGLTEVGCVTAMDCYENSVGRVGAPFEGIHLRLANWEEGGYRVTDTPYPRGEVMIGGDIVAHGYFNMEVKTMEEFFIDDDNRRWFKTGDIGQVEQDGTLRIIDRKKDLVKLQNGEYISPGKVENVLKGCSVVENVCVFGNSMKNYVVALVCPNPDILTKMAHQYGKQDMNISALCQDKDVSELVLSQIKEHGSYAGLQKNEIPTDITLTSLEWTPTNGLTTAAMKLKRKAIQKQYQDSLDKMFSK